MVESKLFTRYKLGNTELKNHIVMAPMTRSRAIGNVPNELIANYYSQRSGADHRHRSAFRMRRMVGDKSQN